MDSLATQGPAKVQGNLVTQFTDFAGSEANAQSLVTGLRGGTPVTLTTTTGNTTTVSTVDTPTRPMGYGNVFISLALAKQQLAGYGITDPTAQEIQAALTGGTITTSSGATVTLKGVLTQRADGMGWGAIAKSQGVSLGHVVSGLKSANQQVAAGGSSASGITTAGSGTTTTQTGASVRGNSANAPGHNRVDLTGSGIVTAGGAGIGAGASAGARAGGVGIVSGGGAANSHGLAKGLNKP